jgi:Leucine-rich repeat (LRR) protein
VLFADLNAVGVSSVAVPISMLTLQQTVLEAGLPVDNTAADAAAAAAAGEEDAETLALSAVPDESQSGDTEPPTAAAEDAPAAPAAEGSNATEVLLVEQHAAEAEQPQCSGPGLQEFNQLCALHLSDNQLSCIAGLAWLPALQQLILSANRLRSLQGLAQVLHSSSSSSSSIDAAAEGVANVVQQQDTEGQRQQQADADAAIVPKQCAVIAQRCCPAGFSCLRLLDVSFNLIPAEQLLGISSPLAQLPR